MKQILQKCISLLIILSSSTILQAQDLWDGTTIASGFHGGTGTASDPYQIRTGAQLKYFEQQVNAGNTFSGKTVLMMNSIDLGNHSLEIRNTFAGTFDGNGYYLEQIFQQYSIFKNVQGTIKHLGIRSGVYREDRYPYFGKICLAEVLEVGGFIENCYHELSKNYYSNSLPYLIDYHPFLVENNYGTIRNCYAKGNYTIYDSGGVWGAYLVGMLVEINNETGVIENCAASTYNNGLNARGQQQPLATTNNGTITSGTNTTASYFAAPSVCTVEFVDLLHGKSFAQRSIPCGQPVGTLPSAHENWTLTKWTRYGKAVNETATVEENWTLFALWEQIIQRQPTANDMSVMVDDEEHAQFQWYRFDEDDDWQYGDWTSTNHEYSSYSSVEIKFSAKANQHLHFSYWVSSEEGFDEFKAYLNGQCILTASGEVSDIFDYLIEESGNYTLRLQYHKDDDSSAGSDMVKVTNITVPGGNGVILDCTQSALSPSFLTEGNKYFCKISYSNTNAVLMTDTVAYIPSTQIVPTDITQLANVIYIDPTEARTGTETTISFKMKNTAAIRGFQFDLVLPEGVTPVEEDGEYVYWLNVDRAPKKAGGQYYHTLDVTKQPDGSYRFLCGAQQNKTFIGNDGEVAVLKVNIAEDMQEGDHSVILRNIKLTETDISNYYQTDEVVSKLTIVNYIPGDISNDGIVDVSDYIGVANHILGNTPAGFNARAADVNKDNAIDVSDYIGVANIILTGSIYGQNVSASRSKVRGANTDVSTIDNVIYIEPLSVTPNGRLNLSLKMKNSAAIRGFQFDLELPEGVTPVEEDGEYVYWLNVDRAPKKAGGQYYHTLEVTRQTDGTYRFLCGAQQDKTFLGNDGEVAVIQVDVAADMTVGDYPIILKYVKLTESDISHFYLTDELVSTLTVIGNTMPGDANGDGTVDIADVTAIINYINGNVSSNFNEVNADVNSDGKIDIADVTGIINIINS